MYDYRSLERDLKRLAPYAKTGVIGRSVLKRPIPYIFVGEMGKKQILVQSAIHAREHITAQLTLLLIDRLLATRRLKDTGVWFVPMANPDGVELAIHGPGSVEEPARREFLLGVNGGSPDFSLWKANANAVDLNNNFPALWGEGIGQVRDPAPSAYVGCRPLSEPESRALSRFTCQVKPSASISYHCKGEVIYWDFGLQGEALKRDRRVARCLSRATGYRAEVAEGSTGGYKDWCSERLKIPAFTIEVGSDDFPHPFPYGELERIYRQNSTIIEKLRECL